MALDHYGRRTAERPCEFRALGFVENVNAPRENRSAASEARRLHVNPVDRRIGERQRNAHGSMAMYRGLNIGARFENFGIDDRLARDGPDAGKLLQRIIEMHHPVSEISRA